MKLKILVVDDDKKLLYVLKSLLIEENHEVSVCGDGAEAIKKCREEKYDLIITDLIMPGAGGMEVLKESRKIHPETLVILITGFASIETAIQAIREGAYDYITKPFKLEQIKIVVKNAHEKITLIRENRILFQKLQEAYEKLHIMKKIMGPEKEKDADLKNNNDGIDSNRPFIAGSMLAHYYQENKSDIKQLFLSDLERISALREKGFLSNKEFELCKSKLFRNLKH